MANIEKSLTNTIILDMCTTNIQVTCKLIYVNKNYKDINNFP